jgi:hypothetical protein
LITAYKRALPQWAIFGILFAGEVVIHYPLLRLPYFWDEAGYYIPAARDLLVTGSLIPLSAPSNAHPPLVMGYLALGWKIAGTSPLVTRVAMLAVSAFALLGLFRLSTRVANESVGWATVACTAVYPVFFSQSSMAHLDLAAAAFTFWGVDAFLAENAIATAIWFSLSVLAKETAVLAPGALLAWSVLCPFVGTQRSQISCRSRPRGSMIMALVVPAGVLIGWYGYHFAKTGYVFGNPEFFRYNVQATVSPLRILLAMCMRIWQTFGYLHLWILTVLTCWAMTKEPLRDRGVERPRIAIATQCLFGAVALAYIVVMAVIGGAVLARYMLPVVPLMLLVCVSTFWRRSRHWLALVGAVAVAFVGALFMNPPYAFSFEDNLAYRDYILMHEDAAHYLEAHPPRSRVLTAWPGSDELTRPYLGYVRHPFSVLRVEDFSPEQMLSAGSMRGMYDTAFLFSTKYEPGHTVLAKWGWWQNVKRRYFGYHEDIGPELAASELGGQVVFREAKPGQWAAVISFDGNEDAADRHKDSLGQKMAGVSFDHKPNFPSGN